MAPSWRLCRQHSQGCQARGLAGRAVEQVRAGHQQSDRNHAQPDRPAVAARYRRRGDRMKRRREFITLLSGAAALWSQAASAQNPGGVRRLGVLLSLAESDPEGKAQFSGFTQGLAELGWIDGRNLQMEIRWGRGDIDRIRTFAKELVVLQPDVILAHGTPATAALHRETRTIPIVFVTVSDPVGDGFVAGLPHPGGNITGFLTSESTITAKMFELLTEIAPGLKRVALLFNPDTAPGHGAYYLPDFEAAARSTNIEPIAARARSDGEIEAAVTSLGKDLGGGLIVTPDY